MTAILYAEQASSDLSAQESLASWRWWKCICRRAAQRINKRLSLFELNGVDFRNSYLRLHRLAMTALINVQLDSVGRFDIIIATSTAL